MRYDIKEKIRVKNRIMGILIRDAREDAAMSEAEVAEVLGITEQNYTDFEYGYQAPSLPQLEVIAYLFGLPIEHFWGADLLRNNQRSDAIAGRVSELLMLRQRIIGLQLRQLREAAGLELDEVSELTGHGIEQLERVEMGLVTLPINELELVTTALRAGLRDLVEGHGEVGNWIKAQKEFDAFTELSPEMRAFVLKPINRSYLELARRMSEMNVDKLRTIAESILEITY